MTANNIPVPFTNAPKTSADAANIPTVIPPSTVRGNIYLFKICSNTLGSLLNPGTCNPDDNICFAWDAASIPDVCIQKMENRTAPPIMNKE